MRTLRLGRAFDAVLVHDAIDYMLTEDDLAAALATVAAHLAPDGAAVLLPDVMSETFAPGTSMGGEDDGEGRGARYVEWMHEPPPGSTTYLSDFVFLLREPGGPTRVEHDPHTLGLFPRATWERLIAAAGLGAGGRRRTSTTRSRASTSCWWCARPAERRVSAPGGRAPPGRAPRCARARGARCPAPPRRGAPG